MYTRERRLRRDYALAFHSGEKKRSSFFWHDDCYFIWDIISITKCAVCRQMWLEDHTALPPISQFGGQVIKTYRDFTAWYERYVTGKHLRTIIWIEQFKLPFVMLICVPPGQNNVIRMIRPSNDHSNLTLCSRLKTLKDIYKQVMIDWKKEWVDEWIMDQWMNWNHFR